MVALLLILAGVLAALGRASALGNNRVINLLDEERDTLRRIEELEAEVLEPIESVIARIDRELAPPKPRSAKEEPKRTYTVQVNAGAPEAEPGDLIVIKSSNGRVVKEMML